MNIVVYNDLNSKQILMADLSNIFYKEELLFIYDFPYANKDRNIFGCAFYDKDTKPLVRLELVEPLIKSAINLYNQGYKIKIWDAFRPQDIQLRLWNFAVENDITHIVANPLGYGKFNPNSIGSCHTKGTAIDITLVSKDNLEELDMGSSYDSSEDVAAFAYDKIRDEAKRNRHILNDALKDYFIVHPNEWWHYDFKGEWPLLVNKVKE